MPAASWPLCDLDLARRLERCEARGCADAVEARARVEPAVGAAWIDVAGTYAMFDGVESFLTQSFGLGCFAPVGDGELDALEAFFAGHGALAQHEVSPMTGPAALATLVRRGYAPVEQTSILFQPLAAAALDEPDDPRLAVHAIAEHEVEAWIDVSARGWSEFPGAEAFMRAYGKVVTVRAGGACFLACWDGQPVAAGALTMHAGVALLAGAATVPEARGRGAQKALLRARLRHALAAGCDLAMMGAMPGSTSQRNAERQGFRIAYTRTKWAKGSAGGSQDMAKET